LIQSRSKKLSILSNNPIETNSSKRAYHHGDLRAALVDAAMRLIEAQDAEALSLREVARSVGVSAAAVYRHFPDKSALLTALAHEGLERLGAAQRAVSQGAGHGMDGFRAGGRAYVRFALAHPALFRLIMTHTPMVDHFADGAQASSPMRFLRETVASLAPTGTPPAMLRVAALRAWSKVHGLSMLLLDGQVEIDDSMIDEIIDGPHLWPVAGTV
jgi:AcrR family transcriptional regulator